MPTINVDPAYWSHPKTREIMRILGRAAKAIPIQTWCWFALYHPDTGKCNAAAALDLESWMAWDGPKGKAIDGLVQAGFLDVLPDGSYKVHDWEQWAGHLKRYKERAKAGAKARWKKGVEHASSMEIDACSNASSNACSTMYCTELSSEKVGGLGEGKIAPTNPAAETVVDVPISATGVDLAAQWRLMLRRAPNRTEDPDDLAKFFDELILHGADAVLMSREIADKRRKRTETIWQFEARISPNGQNIRGHQRSSRVESSQDSLAAIERKTIRVHTGQPAASQTNGTNLPGNQPGTGLVQ